MDLVVLKYLFYGLAVSAVVYVVLESFGSAEQDDGLAVLPGIGGEGGLVAEGSGGASVGVILGSAAAVVGVIGVAVVATRGREEQDDDATPLRGGLEGVQEMPPASSSVDTPPSPNVSTLSSTSVNTSSPSTGQGVFDGYDHDAIAKDLAEQRKDALEDLEVQKNEVEEVIGKLKEKIEALKLLGDDDSVTKAHLLGSGTIEFKDILNSRGVMKGRAAVLTGFEFIRGKKTLKYGTGGPKAGSLWKMTNPSNPLKDTRKGDEEKANKINALFKKKRIMDVYTEQLKAFEDRKELFRKGIEELGNVSAGKTEFKRELEELKKGKRKGFKLLKIVKDADRDSETPRQSIHQENLPNTDSFYGGIKDTKVFSADGYSIQKRP